MAHLRRQACVIKSAVTLYCQSIARYSIGGHNWTFLVSWIKEVKSGWNREEASLCFFSRKPSEIPLAFSSEQWAFTIFFNSSGQEDTCNINSRAVNRTGSDSQELVMWLWVLYLWDDVTNTCTILMTELNSTYKAHLSAWHTHLMVVIAYPEKGKRKGKKKQKKRKSKGKT